MCNQIPTLVHNCVHTNATLHAMLADVLQLRDFRNGVCLSVADGNPGRVFLSIRNSFSPDILARNGKMPVTVMSAMTWCVAR